MSEDFQIAMTLQTKVSEHRNEANVRDTFYVGPHIPLASSKKASPLHAMMRWVILKDALTPAQPVAKVLFRLLRARLPPF